MNMHAYTHLISIPSISAKPKPLLPALPSMGESLTLNRKDRTAHTDDNYEYVYMQAPQVVRRESSPESNTLVRNESLEINPTDDCMSGVKIAESDAVRPAHGIASQHSSGKKMPIACKKAYIINVMYNYSRHTYKICIRCIELKNGIIRVPL